MYSATEIIKLIENSKTVEGKEANQPITKNKLNIENGAKKLNENKDEDSSCTTTSPRPVLSVPTVQRPPANSEALKEKKNRVLKPCIFK